MPSSPGGPTGTCSGASSVLIVLALLVLLAERVGRGGGTADHGHRPAAARPTHPWMAGRRRRRGRGGDRARGGGAGNGARYWLLRGLAEQQALGSVWSRRGGRCLASGAAGTLAVLAAIPMCVLAVRYLSRSSALVERTSWVVYALPHITVGLAFLTLAARLGPPIYQSLALLVIAYVVLFLPQAPAPARRRSARSRPRWRRPAGAWDVRGGRRCAGSPSR